MSRLWLILAVAAPLAAALWGCAPVADLRPPVRKEISTGDRDRDWALVFFQSWRQHRKAKYLDLSRRHMASAVKTYFDLQVRIGHSFPDFYLIDRKRRSGCRFLDEIERLAARFRVAIAQTEREGCLAGG